MTAEYFPGSSQPITPPAGPRDLLDGRKGRKFPIKGQEVELFGISDVAALLNRKPVTIRKWEEKGVIPRATFAKPGVNKDPRGRRRLYSRAQVEALVRIAEEEDILHNPHAHLGQTNFQTKVWRAFKEIANS